MKKNRNLVKSKIPSSGAHNCIVYALAPNEDGPTKIGMTKNIGARLTTIQCGNWVPILPMGFRMVVMTGFEMFDKPLKDQMALGAELVEFEAHKKLDEMGFHIRGEWFDLSPSDALSVVEKCARNIKAYAFSLEQVASAFADRGIDPDMTDAQRKMIKRMGDVAAFMAAYRDWSEEYHGPLLDT